MSCCNGANVHEKKIHHFSPQRRKLNPHESNFLASTKKKIRLPESSTTNFLEKH